MSGFEDAMELMCNPNFGTGVEALKAETFFREDSEMVKVIGKSVAEEEKRRQEEKLQSQETFEYLSFNLNRNTLALCTSEESMRWQFEHNHMLPAVTSDKDFIKKCKECKWRGNWYYIHPVIEYYYSMLMQGLHTFHSERYIDYCNDIKLSDIPEIIALKDAKTAPRGMMAGNGYYDVLIPDSQKFLYSLYGKVISNNEFIVLDSPESEVHLYVFGTELATIIGKCKALHIHFLSHKLENNPVFELDDTMVYLHVYHEMDGIDRICSCMMMYFKFVKLADAVSLFNTLRFCSEINLIDTLITNRTNEEIYCLYNLIDKRINQNDISNYEELNTFNRWTLYKSEFKEDLCGAYLLLTNGKYIPLEIFCRYWMNERYSIYPALTINELCYMYNPSNSKEISEDDLGL